MRPLVMDNYPALSQVGSIIHRHNLKNLIKPSSVFEVTEKSKQSVTCLYITGTDPLLPQRNLWFLKPHQSQMQLWWNLKI